MDKKIIIAVSVLIFLAIAGVGLFFFTTRDSTQNPISNIEENTTKEAEIYPDTQEAPVLELTWDGKLDPKTTTRYTPYGVWEGQEEYPEGVAYEPANEMQFYIQTDAKNMLAVAPGIVTQNELHGKSGLVSVRYGENYAITYFHVVPEKNLKIGTKVETGDVVGIMDKGPHPTWGEETWWEIQVTTREGNKFRTMPPYDYFSKEGKDTLNAIAKASKESGQNWIAAEGSYGWTIVDGCSWVKYTKEPSWWNSNRFGTDQEEDSEKDFIDSLGLGWKVGDDRGLIIGPTDECK
jgi:hypothetical protein